MGTGKSYWGARLSEISGFNFFDLDQRIEELTNRKISTLFEEEGEDGFRLLEQKILQEITLSSDNFIMACGGGTPCFFNNLEFMKQQGTVIWLTASLEKIQARLLAERVHRPLVSKLTEKQLKEFITTTLRTRQCYYEKAHFAVDTDRPDAESLLKNSIHV
jgi:shikimate kinase